MSHRHPDDGLLLAHAAGTLDAGGALLLSTHLEGCARCRAGSARYREVGGVLLDTIAPEQLDVGAFNRTLARIDAQAASPAAPRAALSRRPELPDGLHWPAAMAGCAIEPWHTIGPGMHWSRVALPEDATARVFLLRMGAGKVLAQHTHRGQELTQVLYGAFDDGRSIWRAGDLDATDESVDHQPVVTADGECICLVALQGRVRFHGLLASALGAWIGL